jgi:type VI secretion system protein ImpH
MAATSGHATNHLIERLSREPYGFNFFRAVRLLENQYRDQPRIGHSASPKEDPIRFGQRPSLAFAPSTIESVEIPPDGAAPRMFVSFLGLFGPNGPMPLHFTEYARERLLNNRDPTVARFLDVFHHRMLSFFYRAWASSQMAVDLDRPEPDGGAVHQLFSLYIGSLLGIGMGSSRNRDALPDWAKLYYVGRLACPTRNAEGLEAIIGDFLEIPAEIQTFVGQWLPLPVSSQCRLGESPDTGRLGATAIVGTFFWECQLRFQIRLGPMKLADYERLLPNGSSFQRVQCWVWNYIGYELQWDLQLALEAAEVPETHLGNYGSLGWTTWLKSEPFRQDADDLILAGDRNQTATNQ